MIDIAQVSHWLGQLKRGALEPPELEQALKRLKQEREPFTVQRLLYLQTHTTDLESPVIGMAIIENGVVYDAPDDAEDWPYKNVLEAMCDEWRIIKFPELSMAYLDPDYGGMKWEFILEK